MKMLCKVVEVLTQREFKSAANEDVVVLPIILTQGSDSFIGEVVGSAIASLPEGLGGGDRVWCDLSFYTREVKLKDGVSLINQKISIKNVVRF